MVQMITSDAAEPNATIRVRFEKRGSLSYIAHLDLVRTFTKAIARAGIPVRFSEGFNPHPKFSFATAMSIGLESVYEFMDIRIDKNVDTEAAKIALSAALTEECSIEEVYFPSTKFTDILYSSYRIEIVTEGASEELAQKCHEALNAPAVVVFKRSKSGDKDTDIAPYIKEASARYEDGVIRIEVVLNADNATFLNPEYLVTYLKTALPILNGSPLKEGYSVLRTGLYTADMKLFR